ncbi:MAG: ATPase [Treponema sp.]|nr:ATPase [Treponema sp.]
MAKTTAMRLVELMVYREDVKNVLCCLGRLGEFQFQDDVLHSSQASDDGTHAKLNPELELFNRLQNARASLDLPDIDEFKGDVALPVESDLDDAEKLISAVEVLHERELELSGELKRVNEAYNETLAFAKLNVPASQLESLSFLTLRIGKIDPAHYDLIRNSLGDKAVVTKLGEDGSRILVACSKKMRFFVDGELEKVGFVKVEVPKDFMGVPEDALQKLKEEKEGKEKELEALEDERKNLATTHKEQLFRLLQSYSLGAQLTAVQNRLESTQFVYRITGWIPAYLVRDLMKEIDSITEGRTAFRDFMPSEVASVASGHEKVPVRLKHGKVVQNFERMIFSYGSPLYGTIDPTPFVALFFTLLFGIMFGDAGQGLVFFILGILMTHKKVKIGGWEKFNWIFICIGVSSMIMGLLTGEFFANESLLVPFGRFVTGLFGQPRDQILPMMPTGSKESITRMFLFFGFTVAVGFVINTLGLILNIINKFSLKRVGEALFGKTGISGAFFFWYVIAFALRLALFHHTPAIYDWILIGLSLLVTAFGEPLARLVDGHRPVLENGVFAAIIGAIVEIIEVVSSYLSNTLSFVRVGAFALAHAVLGYIIEKLTEVTPGVGKLLVAIVGNAIVIVLEGMIVAIQVVRLQYYEFFSKFFSETGREFKPFVLSYGALRKN